MLDCHVREDRLAPPWSRASAAVAPADETSFQTYTAPAAVTVARAVAGFRGSAQDVGSSAMATMGSGGSQLLASPSTCKLEKLQSQIAYFFLSIHCHRTLFSREFALSCRVIRWRLKLGFKNKPLNLDSNPVPHEMHNRRPHGLYSLRWTIRYVL